MHHSAERVDTVGWTAPSSRCLTLGVGLAPEAVTVLLPAKNFLSLFEHGKFRTPRWLGYLVQQPASDSRQHARCVHAGNRSDVPNGTFHNPRGFTPAAGFYQGASMGVAEMLCFRDVSSPPHVTGGDAVRGPAELVPSRRRQGSAPLARHAGVTCLSGSRTGRAGVRSAAYLSEAPRMRPMSVISLVLSLAAAAATARADDLPVDAPALRVGTTWTYQVRNGFNGYVLAEYRYRVSSVSPEGAVIEVTKGGQAMPPRLVAPGWRLVEWTTFSGQQQTFFPPMRILPFPLAPGATWYEAVRANDPPPAWPRRVQVWGKVLEWETVKVPAGEFRALKIRRASSLGEQEVWRGETQMSEYDWYAPDIGLVVRHTEQGNFLVRGGPDGYWQEVDRFVADLVDYTPAR